MEFKTKVKLAIAAAFGIVVLIVIFQNTMEVPARLLFIEMRMPLVAMLLITVAIGFGLGWLTSALLRRRKRE